jgi:hypothetical protein
MDPVIKAHPNWFCIEILDGFAAHFNSPEALQIYYDHKIIQVKEEGDSSQVNQTYDQYVGYVYVYLHDGYMDGYMVNFKGGYVGS